MTCLVVVSMHKFTQMNSAFAFAGKSVAKVHIKTHTMREDVTRCDG
jgi:hypothetical protein